MNALRLFFIVFMVGSAAIYASAMRALIDTSWLLFAFVAITAPLGLAWIVGNDDDRADFLKIRDWLLGQKS